MADFKAASSAITAVKFGSSDVTKVYMGGDLVWEPTSSSSSYSVSGSLSTYSSTRFSVGSPIETGDTEYWERYSYGEFRKNSNTQLQWILRRQASGFPYSNVAAFLDDYVVNSVTLKVNGNVVAYTSFTAFYSTDYYLKFYFTGTNYDSLWSGFSAGDSVSLEVNYEFDWDKHEQGAGSFESIGAFVPVARYSSSYSLDAGVVNPLPSFNGWTSTPGSKHYSPANKAACSDYFAIYAYDNQSGYGATASDGWYVYGPKVDPSPGSNGSVNYVALGWPTDGADGSGSGNIWTSKGERVSFVLLSSFPSALEGEGGTDAWSVPDLGDWSDYANGVYFTKHLRTSGSDIIAVPGYDATTYTDTMTSMWVTSVTGGYVPTSAHYITGYDGDEAPYIAVYIHEYADDDENIGGSSAKGWYVFKNDTPGSGTYNRTNWETPVAWPSDVSSSRVQTQNESGYLGSNAGVHHGYVVVLLDEYNDPEGSGGTDHWTLPPTVHSDIRTEFNNGANGPGWLADTSANPPNPIYGGKPGSGFGYYHWNPYRGVFLFVKDLEAMGTLTFKAYYRLPNTTTDVFMGEGSYTFTASGSPKQMYFSTNSQFSGSSGASNYIFNTVTYGSRMTLVFEH